MRRRLFCLGIAILAHLETSSGLSAHRVEPQTHATTQRLHTNLWRDGHVHITSVLPSESEAADGTGTANTFTVSAVKDEVLAVAQRVIKACAACPHSDNIHDAACRGCHRHRGTTGPKSFNKARNLHRLSTTLNELVHAPRLLGLAAGLLGVPRVRVYQDALFEKEPGDVESGWHQDSAATPLNSDHVVTLWVALGDLSQTSGTLMFANGSHAVRDDGLSSRGLPLSDRVAAVRHLTDDDVRAQYAVVPPRQIRAGDATAHLGWTFHRAPPNRGSTPRRAFAVTYYADGAKTHQDLIAPPGDTVASGRARGVELQTQDGVNVVVQLLSDDLSTWMPWMMDGWLIPGEPLAPPSV